MAGTYPRPQIVPSDIGQPVSFSGGIFAGRTVRAELEEIQKADLGRKYARKDKRPLDPPPVVMCRFYDVLHQDLGRLAEQQVDPEQIVLGAICHVDLFPIPSYDEPVPKLKPGLHGAFSSAAPPVQPPSAGSNLPVPSVSQLWGIPSMPDVGMAGLSQEGQGVSMLPPVQMPPMQTYAPMPYTQFNWLPSAAPPHAGPVAAVPGHSTELPQFQAQGPVQPPPPDGSATAHHVDAHHSDIVAWYGSYPIRENTKCTVMLSGSTFMNCSMLEHRGEKVAMFAFSDLAVKMEGTFVLRYRTLNVFSHSSTTSPDAGAPILAECFGGPFRVYSTKDFPGLNASTELSKRLALYGVRVNVRESERKRHTRAGPTTGDPEHPHSGDDPMYSGTETTAGTSSPTRPYSPNSPYMRWEPVPWASHVGTRSDSTSPRSVTDAASSWRTGTQRDPLSLQGQSPWDARSGD
ncbi:hypothetical protein BV20DRAFT_978121 [Pilatotrama ljubarskyi]|nr:hypothetical protein BV20DRAFT_978121 [Pilatotrama ljubarskyi]